MKQKPWRDSSGWLFRPSLPSLLSSPTLDGWPGVISQEHILLTCVWPWFELTTTLMIVWSIFFIQNHLLPKSVFPLSDLYCSIIINWLIIYTYPKRSKTWTSYLSKIHCKQINDRDKKKFLSEKRLGIQKPWYWNNYCEYHWNLNIWRMSAYRKMVIIQITSCSWGWQWNMSKQRNKVSENKQDTGFMCYSKAFVPKAKQWRVYL